MKNLILLGMSTLPRMDEKTKDFKTSTFRLKDDDGVRIENCKSQLEPIVKLFIQENPEDELEIVVLCSQETLIKDEKLQKNAYEYFVGRIKEYVKEENLAENKVQFEKVEIDDLSNMEAAINEAVTIIRNWNKEQNNQAKLWVDNHGGLRELAVLMDAIISLLESEGIEPEHIYSVEFLEKGPRIIDTTYLVNIIDFASGINSFINFGDATILSKWYESNDNENIVKIIQAMKMIDDATRMCAPVFYREGCNKLSNAINKYKIEEGETKNKDDYLMDIFIDAIKKDYGEILTNKQKRNSLIYVQRSVKKRQYQQALTFLESLMPELIWSKFLHINKKEQNQIYYNGFKQKHEKTENYLFNQFTYNLYEKNNKEIVKNVLSNRIEQFSEFYEAKKVNGKQVELPVFELPETIDCKKRGGGATIKLNYELKVEKEKEQLFLQFSHLHYYLKQCRNNINHSTYDPNKLRIEWIVNCLNLYVKMAEELLEGE